MDVDERELEYLAGVIDGGALITVYVKSNETYSLGYQFWPVVQLNYPKTPGNQSLLGRFISYCEDVGAIFSTSERNREGEGHRLKVTVDRPWAIEEVLRPLLPYLTAKHRPAQLMVEEVVPRFQDEQQLEKEGAYELMGIVEEIRPPTNESKYDQRYFAKEWESVAE
jgi:hypothetical protein